MKPVKFPESNRCLKAPSGMENCIDLHTFTDGEHSISKWRLDWRDRIAVLLGGHVWLWVVSGHTQPPVTIDIANPWPKQGGKK